MRPYTIEGIKRLIEPALDSEFKTGDFWLDTRYREDIPIIGHVNPYYRWFYLIAQTYRPGFVVEIGSWRATAAAHFASPIKGEVVTIDIHRAVDGDTVAPIKAREADAQYPNLHFVHAWSGAAVPVVKAWGREIDILYIDGWHEYEWAMADWNNYSPMLSNGALVICDDIFDGPGATVEMERFWEEISAPYKRALVTNVHLPAIPMGVFKYVR